MKKHFLCISVADIHGNKVQYEKLKQLVRTHKIAFVFLCGDLLPKDGGSWHIDNKVRTIAMQADFINSYFLGYLAELGALAEVYAVFGNDDFMSNYSILSNANIPRVHFLRNQTLQLPIDDELYVAGYPYIGMTPFLHKDWEKWDVVPNELPHKIYRSDGYVSEEGQHIAVEKADDVSTIKDDLTTLARKSNPKKTIYVFHEAPFNTPLDRISQNNPYIKDGQHNIGSKAIREFIESEQPLLTMHGHIHETYAESGEFTWKSGHSVSITAANDFSSDTLSYVLFTLPDLGRLERLSA
ncbi:metallophosphoesterase family protein [Candidatus Saccharibacteria bacterium]|nr:metallophosphoesterase family protein [Candidatus Saccharibacteria bacterium]